MLKEKLDFHTRAIDKVKRLWNLYIIQQDLDQLQTEFGALPDNLLVIGTGRHEFYKNKDAFMSGLGADQAEAQDVRFELQDEWYDVQEISDTICIVYGSIWAREKATPGKTVYADMEGSRFTLVCKDLGDGIEICSIHHSMPYIDQGINEYYPKTLISLANETLQKNRLLEQRMELDHMTELYSRYYMERHVSRAMKKSSGCFFVFDLDNFKAINDTMGHLVGDRVIQSFACLLRSLSTPENLLGRMGGDEFAAWDSRLKSPEEAEQRFAQLTEGCRQLSSEFGISVNCSAGITFCQADDISFTELYHQADQALYQAKRQGKACLCHAVSREEQC